MSLKLKRIAIAVLGILLTLSISMSLAFFGSSGMTASADIIEKEDITNKAYVFNKEETFPESTTFNYKGTDVVANRGVIVFPNGTAYSIQEGKKFKLNLVGDYTLKYFYTENGADVTVYDKFSISNNLFSLSDTSEGNAYSTVLKEEMGDEVYKNIDSRVPSAQGYYGGPDYATDPNKGSYGPSIYSDGIILRMKKDVTFAYAEPIDLTQVSEDGLSNVLSFGMKMSEFYDENGCLITNEKGQAVEKKIMKTVNITLTDCYDPTRFINVVLDNSKSGAVYARVSTQDMESKAMWISSTFTGTQSYDNGGSVREAFYGSERSVVWTKNYGASCDTTPLVDSWRGKVHLRYDNDNGIMYWGYEKNANVKGGSTSLEHTENIYKGFIMDIKDPAVTGGVSFEGFTTGEVYLTVQMTDAVVNEAARFEIYSVGNKNARDIINETRENEFKAVDNKAPVIKVDYNSTLNGGVYAQVGKKFNIPSAEAFDVNANGNVSVAVCRNYGTSSVSYVSVENNTFTVDREDIYYIVYTATDYYGNQATEIVKVYGINQEVIALDKQVIEDGFEIMDVQIMKLNSLPLGQKISTLNIYDDLKLKIEFISNKESFVFADLKNGQEIDEFWAEQQNFTVMYAGTYKVVFTYSDNAVSYVYDCEFTAIPNQEDVSFAGKPFIPRILLKDANYDLESVDVISYANGYPEIAGKAQLQIKFDDGDFIDIPNVRKVNIAGSQTAQLKAVYNNQSILSDVAVIKDVNYEYAKNNKGRNLNGINYFDFEEGAFAVPEGEDLLFVSNNGNAQNTLKFANMVNIADFALSFKILDNYSEFNRVNITLTDPYDTNTVLKLSFYKQQGSVYFSFDNTSIKLTNTSFTSSSTKEISFYAKSGELNCTGASKKYFSSVQFSSKVAYLDIEVAEINGKAGILIDKINRQQLKRTTRDNRKPEIVSDIVTGIYGIDEIINITPLDFVDVLSILEYDALSTTFGFYTDEDIVYQTSIDNVKLDGNHNDPERLYQVKIQKLGSYYYEYKIMEPFGNNETNGLLIVESVDRTAPTIKFTGQIKEDVIVNAKVGDTIKFKYTLSDNITSTENLTFTVMVFDITNSIIYPISGSSYKFNSVGKYQIAIVCQDEANNVSIKSFDVIVSEVEQEVE